MPTATPVCAMDPLDVGIAAVAVYVLRRRERRRRQQAARRPRLWARLWLTRRVEFGWYHNLMVELELEDAPTFKNFLRVDVALFREILEAITPLIEPAEPNAARRFREPLPPGLKLAITLRHFASGANYVGLSYGFRVAPNTIHYAIKKVSRAIVQVYKRQLVVPPNTEEGWRAVSDEFAQKWQFHHCLGAIDGKHIAVRKPPKLGSLYYNYKGFFSIILLALVDANYKFMWVDIGSAGCCSDAQIFNHCDLKPAMEQNWMHVPQPDALPHDDADTPYHIVADDAFALTTWCMKPYAIRGQTRQQRLFNYRLSRARRVVENAFGILANRFRCLLGKLLQDPPVVVKMVMAMCCLHNLMRDRYPALQNAALDHERADDHEVVPGAWRQDQQLSPLRVQGGNNALRAGKEMRDYLCQYYNNPVGAVPWQDRMI